jgi:Nif-specific regulatory protein
LPEETPPVKHTLQREISELTLLLEISRILDRSMDLRDVAGPMLKAMADLMGMLRGTLSLVDKETGQLSIEEAIGLSPTQADKGRYRIGEGVTGKVVQTGIPAVVPKISKEPLFLNRTGARRLKKGEISFICVPIKIGDEVIGALSADRLFSEEISLHEDVRLLTIIASMIAQGVRLRQAALDERRRLMDENSRLQEALKERFRPANIIGNSRVMRDVFDLISQVSRSDATVLLRGESGTGKELVAAATHFNSRRATRPFVKVNCGALPETLLESELFGHEKGSFTGAINQRKGRFEMADGGTIFLDEVGDLAPATQIRLLRVLQEREFERVGGMETIKVDVRVIAATNRNLEALISEGKFREDLYYRLNVFPIVIPPLRERKTDIPLLVDHFIEKYARSSSKEVKRISTSAINMLMAYHWPGNVRELENCIERAVLLTHDEVIHGHHLPPTLQTAEYSGTIPRGTLKAMMEGFEKEIILDALKSARGQMAKAARALGTTERILGLRVRKFRIQPKNLGRTG